MKYNKKLGKKIGYHTEESCNKVMESLLGPDYDKNGYIALHIKPELRKPLEKVYDEMGLEYNYGYEEMNDPEIPNEYLKFEEKSSFCQASYIYHLVLNNDEVFDKIAGSR